MLHKPVLDHESFDVISRVSNLYLYSIPEARVTWGMISGCMAEFGSDPDTDQSLIATQRAFACFCRWDQSQVEYLGTGDNGDSSKEVDLCACMHACTETHGHNVSCCTY